MTDSKKDLLNSKKSLNKATSAIKSTHSSVVNAQKSSDESLVFADSATLNKHIEEQNDSVEVSKKIEESQGRELAQTCHDFNNNNNNKEQSWLDIKGVNTSLDSTNSKCINNNHEYNAKKLSKTECLFQNERLERTKTIESSKRATKLDELNETFSSKKSEQNSTQQNTSDNTKTRVKQQKVNHAGFNPDEWRSLLKLKYLPSWLALACLAIFAFIPNCIRDLFCFLLSFPLSKLNITIRRIAFANMHLAFPNYTDQDCLRLYRKQLAHMLTVMLSYGEASFLPKFMLKWRWKTINTEVLEKAKKIAEEEGRPIIFCVPHVIAVDRGGLFLSAHGLPMFAFVNDQRNPVFNWFMNMQRIRFGGTIHTRKAGFRSIIRALKQGNHCFMLIDEDLGPKTANFLNFLGTPKATVSSLPRLALATNAQVIFLYESYNMTTGNYELTFEELANFPDTRSNEAMIDDLQRMNDITSAQIYARPEQYMWFLRLFKTNPDERYFDDPYQGVDLKFAHNRNRKADFAKRRLPSKESLFKATDRNPVVYLDYSKVVATLYGEENFGESGDWSQQNKLFSDLQKEMQRHSVK